MTKTGLRLLALSSAALIGLAVTAAATPPAPPAPHYVQPQDRSFVRVAGLFGESDEEKAARLAREQHEADQDAQLKALNDKIRDLEDSVRNLTGQNEELGHRVSELNAKIDRQQKDFEYRLCALAAQQLGASTGGDANAVPCPGSVAPSAGAPMAAAPPQPQNDGRSADTAPRTLAPPPGVLGTLPAGAGPSGGPAAAAPDAGRAQFSGAMNLLAKARYDEARAAFRGFADANPDSDLAPQAVYWVGDIAYVQKDYDGATRAFAEVIKKYPTSVRAPDSMLKLGQALIASGQKKEGCTALAALPAKYPKAAKAVLEQGADARKTCRGTS
ncbi:MAG: tol-pal system protein YbgF [Rhizomicrobium sp.]